MRSLVALLNRELIEHKGAFVIAPAILVGLLIVVAALGLFSGNHAYAVMGNIDPSAAHILSVIFLMGFGLWTIYAMIALFFYYADSFSADQRNNALLFWKSMPVSDLKILASKAVAGITIFPALILGFAVISALILYLFSLIVAMRLPIPIAGPLEMISIWVQASITGAVYMLLSILWYAPFLALVAGLSTLFKRWSIPLAILLPMLAVLIETILIGGNGGRTFPLRDYLAYRRDGLVDDKLMFETLINGQMESPLMMLNIIIAQVDWLNMGLGLVFAAIIVVLASEYRRRKLET